MSSYRNAYHKPQNLTTVDLGLIERGISFAPEPKPPSCTTKPFIMWDGEAVLDGAGYCLFGNSAGDELCGPRLTTKDMLDFMLDIGRKWRRKAFHFAYSFDYDVNEILQDLPWTALIMLRERSRCTWQGYEIAHIPHKSFKVKKDDAYIKIDDVFSYFRSSYVKALVKYDVGSPGERDFVASGKALRPDFRYSDLDNRIRPYWKEELRLGVKLMDKLRRDINGARFYINSWHGPAALAAYSFNKHKVRQYMAPVENEEVALASRTAYAGGWFERFQFGVHDGPVYTADLNSAYVYALSRMPSLSGGGWVHRNDCDLRLLAKTVRLGLFKVRFQHGFSAFMATSHGIPLPLYHRSRNGSISRPTVTEGWYWNYEARIVASDEKTEFLEAYVFEDDGTFPFDWINDMFQERLALQAENNPAEKALKWALASKYGITAQRAGWNRRTRSAPRWHQLEWAGAITSFCRSMIFAGARDVAKSGGLVSIDTDGITSTVPFGFLPNGEGNQLGRWKVESFSGIVYIQNGIYWLRDLSGDWIDPKIRGIPEDQVPLVDAAVEALRTGKPIEISRHTYIGYGAAIRGRRDQWRTWIDSPYKIDPSHSGSRQHVIRICRACNDHDERPPHLRLHDLAMVPPEGLESYPHKLPWLEPDDDLSGRLKDEIFAADL
jgi:hypothetical protein